MVITEYNSPVRHIVIDEFLGVNTNQHVLNLIQKQLPQLEPGQVQTNNGSIEVADQFKRNGNQWLDPFDSEIVNIFRNNFFKFDIAEELNHNKRSHNILLSRYIDGDFYNWHTDLGGFCTWNYFAIPEPKQFTGGDFVLSNALEDANPIDTTVIEPVNDRLIIFPAQYRHKVTPIVGAGTRYSIQVFFA
jgi:Rps23 Pro-64 3,4-dihydroxylase Tpa1-like proline 4-hydroxylase